MKAIERGNNYDTFTVGTSPKISIDTRFVMHDSHNSDKDPLRFLPQADDPHNAELAFEAAQRISETLRPAFPYLEVIKISFYWNNNLQDGPIIAASTIMVDPMTNKKERIEVLERIRRFRKSADETAETMEEDMLKSLIQNLVTAVRNQIDAFRAERAALAATVEHFDSLPQAL